MKTSELFREGAAALVILALLATTALAQTSVPTRLTIDYALTSVEQDRHPGDSGLMTLVIKNVGGQDAKDLEIYIPDAGPIRISKNEYIGTLQAGESRTISGIKYNIAENASLGRYTIKINAAYDGYDSYGKLEKDQRDSWELVLSVAGETIFVIDSLDSGGMLKPGDTANIRIGVRNVGIADAYDSEAELSIPAAAAIKVLGASKKYVGDIKSGMTQSFEYTVHLEDSLPTGSYSLPLVLTYRDKDHEQKTASLSVGVKVMGETKISLSVSETDPEEIHAEDEDVEIKLKIDNTGTNDLKNVKVTYVPASPFKNAKSYVQSKDLGTLKASSSAAGSFYADIDENALPGRTRQAFMVEYETEGRKENLTIEVQVDVMESPRFELYSNTTPAAPGQETEIRLSVKNTGSKCYSVNLWALKESTQPFDFEDKNDFIGDLETGESGEAVLRFTVDSDAKAKEYILPIEVRCTRDGDVLVYSKTAKIDVTESAAGGINPLIMLLLALLIAGGFYAYRKKTKKK